MRVTKLGYFSVALLFSISFQNGEATLMLGSMMMAAKAGLMLGKIGVGGMMMMLLAGKAFKVIHYEISFSFLLYFK